MGDMSQNIGPDQIDDIEGELFIKGSPVDIQAKILVIACGALAREIIDIIKLNDWTHIDISCLPASLHNQPQFIPDRLHARIEEKQDAYDKIYVAYADCGTGGLIDHVIAQTGTERMVGPHCYAFFAGQDNFNALAQDEPGTFYLTDYLVRQFDALVWRGMGLDRYPELFPMYFGNYKRLVYLAQTQDPELDIAAKAAAERLGLIYQRKQSGYGELSEFMAKAAQIPAK